MFSTFSSKDDQSNDNNYDVDSSANNVAVPVSKVLSSTSRDNNASSNNNQDNGLNGNLSGSSENISPAAHVQNMQAKIKEIILGNEVVLFMKGTRYFPHCGFSSKVVSILENMGIEFTCIDVLLNNELRQSIKDYTNWPTVPQLYVKGKFLGGCDIITEMYKSGELTRSFDKFGIVHKRLA